MTATVEREEVILVDEDDLPLGTGPKLAVHRQGQLHRALSVQLRDRYGRRRAGLRDGRNRLQ